MAWLAITWAIGSFIGFLLLRHFALRDFGEITVGGMIGLMMFSVVAPAALLVALMLSLEGKGKWMGRVVWTRSQQDHGK